MTLIEAREALEPRILSNKPNNTRQSPLQESTSPPGGGGGVFLHHHDSAAESGSSSDDEFLIANDGGGGAYPNSSDEGEECNSEEEENNNYRDNFFSLPTLGLNYLNNLNLSLNLNINLRNSSFWRIYENTSFTKPGRFLSNYLGKHHPEVDGDEDGLDTLNEHDMTPDTRGYFTITNFLRRHGFPSFEDEDCYSEEAILERVRFKKLQQAAVAEARKLAAVEAGNNYISSSTPSQFQVHKNIFSDHSVYGASLDDPTKVEWSSSNQSLEEEIQRREVEAAHCERYSDLLEGGGGGGGGGGGESDFGVEIKKISSSSCDNASVKSSSVQMKKEVKTKKKTAVGGGDALSTQMLNPFYNRVELSWWDKVKICLLSVLVLPVKVVLMAVILVLALLLSLVGMYGVTFEESQNRPLPKWRRAIRWILANIVMRAFVFCTGFVWSIKETGKIATPEEAPIFVVGPHSSYFDAFVVILLGAPSVVAKLSTKDIPVFGRLVTFTQAVYVSRESKGSRRQTMEVLKQRAQDVYHGNGMPQIFIFPEGTCSNRSSLIKFKPGAFVPQVPVQPVLIRYPNRFDSCTWTFDGPPAGKNIWCALAQLYNRIEIEYLPVYKPSEEEKEDSALFADNVRKVMAKALNVPLSDYQFEDGTLLCNMREKGKLVQKFHSIHHAKRALGLAGSLKETTYLLKGSSGAAQNYEMGFYDFQREFFHVSSEDTTVPEVQAAFNCFKKDKEEQVVDIRSYLVLTCMLYEERKMLSFEDLPRKACQMYGQKESEVSAEDMRRILELLLEVPSDSDAGKSSQSQPSQQSSNEAEIRISRILAFAKLFADEVTERLPKTYPGREDRDKRLAASCSSSSAAKRKSKSD